MSTETFDERMEESEPAEQFFETAVRERGLNRRYTIQELGKRIFDPQVFEQMKLFRDHTGRPNRLRWCPDFIVADRTAHLVSLFDVKVCHGENAVIELDALETYRRFEHFFNVPVVLILCTPTDDGSFTMRGVRAFNAWRGRLYPSQPPQSGSGSPFVHIPGHLLTDKLYTLGLYLQPEKQP
jgi:hypothetical protein